MNSVDLLQGGSGVETPGTPKRGTPARCHHHTPPVDFAVDVWR